ncbi:ATP-binding protein [Lactiplantibacillus plantarum]|uniref:ATP-binding protein n=1 Tax=Lactiplantibacillus plantarum TaxID=1590 RepID=UPI000DEC5B83|nr:ATP-binding protein [Lactiplantibacillus plantarum]RCI88639.1 transcriptional regulator [Lactiplantibacillus plantarum]
MQISDIKKVLNREYGENEILELKESNGDPDRIAKYISALSNEAALLDISEAYLIWGINDKTFKFVGTDFVPEKKRRGNENLIGWLERSLTKNVHFKFEHINDNDKEFVVLLISKATAHPVRFKGSAYIRSGSSLKDLNEFPDKESILWQKLNTQKFEMNIAKEINDPSEIRRLLDVDTYTSLLNISPIENDELLFEHFLSNKIICKSHMGYAITNLGALSLAKNIASFPTIAKKGVRVIVYDGNNKLVAKTDYTGIKGYAVGFKGLLRYVSGQVPHQEIIEDDGQRKNISDFGALEIRELIANALVHQDLNINGTHPTIEIYDTRVEISNPGIPVIDVSRFLDLPPKSRNENLADLFKQFGFVEERGSGIDKVVYAVESKELPAPEFLSKNNSVIATLFSKKEFKDLSESEKIRAVYLHASLRFTSRKYLTNSSLRERFGVSAKKSSQISKAISSAVSAKLIIPYDPDAGTKFMKYKPFWA